MQPLFREPETDRNRGRQRASSWPTAILGFVGSAVICWIVLMLLAPLASSSWGWEWLTKLWVKIGITAMVAALMSLILAHIEGTIWGRYYVIIGYLLSLALIVWIVLRWLRYV